MAVKGVESRRKSDVLRTFHIYEIYSPLVRHFLLSLHKQASESVVTCNRFFFGAIYRRHGRKL